MSLARAFTKRIKREDPGLTRSGTARYAPGTIKRDMISLPTELISTTNVQALTAPDIRSLSASSADSVSSGNDSDFFTIDRSFLSQNSADDSSIDGSSPATPITPAMESTSSFFGAKSPVSGPIVIASEAMPDTPALPQRAPSHSKKAHVELSRKNLIQRMSPPPTQLVKPTIRTSTEILSPSLKSEHPFGKELAKVNEVAEKFGAVSTLIEEEEQEILSKGLHKFSVDDYINEIVGLYGGGVFEGKLGTVANPWV